MQRDICLCPENKWATRGMRKKKRRNACAYEETLECVPCWQRSGWASKMRLQAVRLPIIECKTVWL